MTQMTSNNLGTVLSTSPVLNTLKTLATTFQGNQAISHHQELMLLWTFYQFRWRMIISKMTTPLSTKVLQKITLCGFPAS